MFQESKNLQQGFLDELKQLDTQKLALQKESRVFEEAAKDVEFLVKRIEESRDERNRLQKEFDVVTRQPFFKRETDQNSFKRVSDLESKIAERDRAIKDAKDAVLKADEAIKQLSEEHKAIKVDREVFTEEIDKLRNQVDPSSMSLADIQKKIHDLDPSMFRQVMKDLKYDGDEPVWAKYDFMERFKIGGGADSNGMEENDPKHLKKEIERLKVERRDLAAELEKVQNLLKMQVNIDKETQYICEQEIAKLKATISAHNRNI